MVWSRARKTYHLWYRHLRMVRMDPEIPMNQYTNHLIQQNGHARELWMNFTEESTLVNQFWIDRRNSRWFQQLLLGLSVELKAKSSEQHHYYFLYKSFGTGFDLHFRRECGAQRSGNPRAPFLRSMMRSSTDLREAIPDLEAKAPINKLWRSYYTAAEHLPWKYIWRQS